MRKIDVEEFAEAFFAIAKEVGEQQRKLMETGNTWEAELLHDTITEAGGVVSLMGSRLFGDMEYESALEECFLKNVRGRYEKD